MTAHKDILRTIPNFPNYTFATFGYPERIIQNRKDSLVVLGPPIHHYNFRPQKSCQVHVSGIPDWACMSDVVEIFERFGKIFSIELSMCIIPLSIDSPFCNGWARVTFISYDGAQNALFAHLSRRIPGSVTPLSIYKGNVSNAVMLKNLPSSEPRSQIIERLNDYPGLLSISFLNPTTARVNFLDMDLALLFMDIVSAQGVTFQGFTCTVDTAMDDEDDGDSYCMNYKVAKTRETDSEGTVSP